jgi:hypothetical protein
MKQKDLKKYSNDELDELHELMVCIRNNGMAKLPLELQEYVKTDKPNGNEMTRTWRLFKLAGEEVIKRFLYKELIETNTVAWFEKRIAELQTEYDELEETYDCTKNILREISRDNIYQQMLTIGGKLKGYKEGLAYMKSHNVE